MTHLRKMVSEKQEIPGVNSRAEVADAARFRVAAKKEKLESKDLQEEVNRRHDGIAWTEKERSGLQETIDR